MPSASALNRKLTDNGQSLISIDLLCSTITELREEQLKAAPLSVETTLALETFPLLECLSLLDEFSFLNAFVVFRIVLF